MIHGETERRETLSSRPSVPSNADSKLSSDLADKHSLREMANCFFKGECFPSLLLLANPRAGLENCIFSYISSEMTCTVNLQIR